MSIHGINTQIWIEHERWEEYLDMSGTWSFDEENTHLWIGHEENDSDHALILYLI